MIHMPRHIFLGCSHHLCNCSKLKVKISYRLAYHFAVKINRLSPCPGPPKVRISNQHPYPCWVFFPPRHGCFTWFSFCLHHFHPHQNPWETQATQTRFCVVSFFSAMTTVTQNGQKKKGPKSSRKTGIPGMRKSSSTAASANDAVLKLIALPLRTRVKEYKLYTIHMYKLGNYITSSLNPSANACPQIRCSWHSLKKNIA